MRLNPELIHFNSMFDQVMDSFKMLIADKKVQFKIYVDPTLVDIIVDPDRLRQVLYNYISNALKFVSQEGIVEVAVVSSP